MGLCDTILEALSILGNLSFEFQAIFSKLKLASVSTVVHHAKSGINLECFLLKSLTVLFEGLKLTECIVHA
jgi:hypothetical protein